MSTPKRDQRSLLDLVAKLDWDPNYNHRAERSRSDAFAEVPMNELRESFPAQAVFLLDNARGSLKQAADAESVEEATALIREALQNIETLLLVATRAAADGEIE